MPRRMDMAKKIRRERTLKILRIFSQFMNEAQIMFMSPEELEDEFYTIISTPTPIEADYMGVYYGTSRTNRKKNI